MIMKKNILPHLTLIATMLIFLGIGSVKAAILDIVPNNQSVLLGDTVNIDLNISGLGNFSADSLGAFDLDINFDPSILSFNNAVFGNQLDIFDLGSITGTTPGAGSVNLFELSLDPSSALDTMQAGSFTLVTLAFDTLATGSSILSMSKIFLSDAPGNPLLIDSVNNGSVIVTSQTTVPEPGILWLFCVSLFMLPWWKRSGD